MRWIKVKLCWLVIVEKKNFFLMIFFMNIYSLLILRFQSFFFAKKNSTSFPLNFFFWIKLISSFFFQNFLMNWKKMEDLFSLKFVLSSSIFVTWDFVNCQGCFFFIPFVSFLHLSCIGISLNLGRHNFSFVLRFIIFFWITLAFLCSEMKSSVM